MGGRRKVVYLCHCCVPATIVAADEVCTKGSVWLCSSGCWGGVKVYTITKQDLSSSVSIRREGEVVSLSKKTAAMTSEP